MSTGDTYLLDGHNVVRCADENEWIVRFGATDNRVARDEVGPYLVSTIFIGVDYNAGDGAPLVFETLSKASGVWDDLNVRRYSTWDEAEAGHRTEVERVQMLHKGAR